MKPVISILSNIGGRRAILGLGSVYIVLSVLWPFVRLPRPTPLEEELIVSILVGGAGITLFYVGYRLPQTDIRPEFFDTVASWCFRAVGVMVAILVFIGLVADLNDPAHNFLILPALAAIAGTGAGRHDARAKTRTFTLKQRNRELQETQAELEETVTRLEESEQRYRTLTENFPNGAVALLDDELRHTIVGGQGFESVDFGAADLQGERVQEVYSGEILETIESHYRATLAGEPTSFELTMQGRVFEFHTHPLTDDGDVYAILAMSQDITERKQHEEKLEQLVADLEESNERLEQFAYAASHDLQEPLRMVSTYLQLIERRYGEKLDEEGEELFEYALDGAERMRSMIDGLLQYSRIETMGGEFEPVDLDTVFDDVREDLRVQIEESGAEITSDRLPRVKGDADQLRQLVQNLLSNAIEYSGEEAPQVRVSAERNGDTWVVSVTDHGIGIDPDDQEQIFEVFEGLHGDGDYAGTGIGLAVCERIVERHDGEIWVDSEPDEGSTFSFTLPAVTDSAT
ncbi:sensor histidine kinase [Halopiger aswanensis]|uniref:histidine kinase n=1 Tax=Halopiger aswanensis TaxID=148449 RepID=A0A419WR18_9EURY|nr:ATP-binding protein [Halopiger aswanensis]RKD97920.1 PAS domain S-box-containing protein [Halopiger aswanensis]